jgi:hypothetical protein
MLCRSGRACVSGVVVSSSKVCRYVVAVAAVVWSCAAASSATEPTLQSMSIFSSGGAAEYTAVADVNRDSKQDELVSNYNGTINVLLGNGDGTFGAPKAIAALPAGSYPIATADFNRDGITDLAVLDPTKETISIYLGNGDGTFEAPKTQVVGNSPAYMAIGDVNGDGKPDVILSGMHLIGGVWTYGFTVMLGAGTGYLHAPHFVGSNNGVGGWVLTVGDVNGDGHLDVVASAYTGAGAEVYLGNGNGTFREQSPISLDEGPSEILLADLYGNGKLDLAIGDFGYENSQGQVEVMEGLGDGTFSQNPVYLTAGYFPAWLAAADMNSDGRQDLVVGNSYSNSVSVMLNQGGGQFAAAAPDNFATPELLDGIGQGPMSIGDFNGDGRPDVAVASAVGVDILMNLGGGVLNAPRSVELGATSGQMFTADMTGDGHLDLAAQTWGYNGSGGAIQLVRGDGQGNFASNSYEHILPFTDPPYPLLAGGSFNGNGKVGVAAYVYGGQILPTYNNGAGTFTIAPPVNLVQQDQPQYMCAGDFNGDGYSDFAVLSYDQVDIYLNKHDGTYSGPLTYAVGANPVFVMTRDLNGDGKKDLVVANKGGNSVSVLLGKDDGTFWPAKEYGAGNSPSVVTTGDFNRDGKIDLAVGDASSVAILLGNGSGSFSAARSYAAPGPVTYVAVADLRGTGVEDLLTTATAQDTSKATPERMYLLSGNGNGTFNAPEAFMVGSNPYWIVIGDFNQDGAQDVAVSSWFGSSTVVVFLNQRGTRLSLTASAGTVGAGKPVTLIAMLEASVAGSGIPSGTVTFRDGSKTLGSMSLSGGKAMFTTSGLSVGKHTITASYWGSTGFNPHASAATTITVE